MKRKASEYNKQIICPESSRQMDRYRLLPENDIEVKRKVLAMLPCLPGIQGHTCARRKRTCSHTDPRTIFTFSFWNWKFINVKQLFLNKKIKKPSNNLHTFEILNAIVSFPPLPPHDLIIFLCVEHCLWLNWTKNYILYVEYRPYTLSWKVQLQLQFHCPVEIEFIDPF